MREKPLTEDERNPFDGKPKTASVGIRRTTMDGKEVVDERPEVRTMKIKLNTEYTGSLDGIHVTTFAAGQQADMPARIAQTLLEDGRASLPAEAKAEAKMTGGAPENKMLDGPGSSKDEAGAKRGGRKRN